MANILVELIIATTRPGVSIISMAPQESVWHSESPFRNLVERYGWAGCHTTKYAAGVEDAEVWSRLLRMRAELARERGMSSDTGRRMFRRPLRRRSLTER